MIRGRAQDATKSSGLLSRGPSQTATSTTSVKEIKWRIPGPTESIHIQDNIQRHLSGVGQLLSNKCDYLRLDMILRIGQITIPTNCYTAIAHSPFLRRRFDQVIDV
ncbi:unnamed protein product [Anisakis simplex]|uniref:Uncharacterized protein n=1 Tax=Anisakis simplex TaxID=6269 RepID=A0A0M3JHP4_ANISI|nr:unnamed protein product [Anisakis simplex]